MVHSFFVKEPSWQALKLCSITITYAMVEFPVPKYRFNIFFQVWYLVLVSTAFSSWIFTHLSFLSQCVHTQLILSLQLRVTVLHYS